MKNLQDIVIQLKHSVEKLDQLTSVGFKCKEQRIDGPDTIEDISLKQTSLPDVTIVKPASSSGDEPDSVSNYIQLLAYNSIKSVQNC